MNRNSFVGVILVSILLVAIVCTFIFTRSRALQKDTCKRNIENSFSVFLKENSYVNSALTIEWKKIDLNVRVKLLKYANENNYPECGEFSYLIAGNESDGSELNIYMRRKESGNHIEVLLDK